MELTDNILSLDGMGQKTAEKFKKLGVITIEDLLWNLPKKYKKYPIPNDIDNIHEGDSAIFVHVSNRIFDGKNGQKKLAINSSRGYTLWLTWFQNPYIDRMIFQGNDYIFYGNVTFFNGNPQMSQPEFFTRYEYEKLAGSIVPIYKQTAGLKTNSIFKFVIQAIEKIRPVSDVYSDTFRYQHNLITKWDTIRCIHWPANYDVLEMAKRRIIFDELLTFVQAVKLFSKSKILNKYQFYTSNISDLFIQNLPYALTNSQKEAFNLIKKDLSGEYLTNRLVQGDVGCGKTVVAELSMVFCAENNYQSALMAPTEVLAKQHFEDFKNGLSKIGKLDEYNPQLLVGSTSQKEKKKIYELIKNGKTKIIIGTHALIQDRVEYNNLALAIIDEQHRFGVEQRNKFSEKTNNNTHVVIMTATPIPRTTASVIFGGISVSYMKDKPANRLPIKNCSILPSQRNNAYQFLIKKLSEGDQGYIICPLVEGDDDGKKSVEMFSKTFQNAFPQIKISTLHGKMSSDKKNQNMDDFAKHKTQVLISTTVVEVGVNVPNATVMIVESANMFGLLQLHQLRGRVGRGDKQSYCIFINQKEEFNEKLNIISSSNDGFEIAESDYKIRKAGEILGYRQSGDMGFKLADVIKNEDILKEVQSIMGS